MKNIAKFVSVLMIAFAMASCVKEAPSKSEVEAGFEKVTKTLPTVSVSVASVTYNYLQSAAEVELTVTGLTNLENLSVGVLSTTDPTFTNTNFAKVESPADGTVKILAKVAGNTTNYFKAVAASTEGTVYSEAVELNVPEFPFWVGIPGTYQGVVESMAYGDQYESTIKIVLDSEDYENKCYIYGFEPYWSSQGYDYTVGTYNFVEAVIDNENKAVIIPYGSDLNLAGRWLHIFTEEGRCHGALTFSSDYSKITQAWEFYTVKADGSAEDYYGAAVYKRK